MAGEKREVVEGSFADVAFDLLFSCQEYFRGNISQDVLLAMIDICGEKMKLTSDKVANKIIENWKKGKPIDAAAK